MTHTQKRNAREYVRVKAGVGERARGMSKKSSQKLIADRKEPDVAPKMNEHKNWESQETNQAGYTQIINDEYFFFLALWRILIFIFGGLRK